MTVSRIKVLVAVDGSDRAMSMIRYVAGQFQPGSVDLKIFNVHDQLPDGFRDIDKDLDFLFRISEVKSWDVSRRKQVRQFLDKAKASLVKSGFDQEKVMVELHERSSGIARDIIAEAKNGYDAVVIARRGLGAVKGMILGSVASKLINNLTWLPLWIVGKKAKPGPMLAAVDGSENSLRFGAHLSRIVREDVPIELFHAVRSFGLANQYTLLVDEMPPLFQYQESEKVARWRAEDILTQCSEMLGESGIDQDLITKNVAFDVSSRAKAIVERAQQARYGTIVMGRRGLSDIREFPIGRVTAKVLQLAKGMTVCVVN